MAATVQILEEEKPITKNKIPNTTKRNSLIIWFIQNIILMPIHSVLCIIKTIPNTNKIQLLKRSEENSLIMPVWKSAVAKLILEKMSLIG